MKSTMFIRLADDRFTGVLTRENALKIIEEKNLEKVQLGSFRSDGVMYFTLEFGHLCLWAWSVDLIRRELKELDYPLKKMGAWTLPLILKDLEFYASTVDSYPLFVLKKGFDKAICVSPTNFEIVE